MRNPDAEVSTCTYCPGIWAKGTAQEVLKILKVLKIEYLSSWGTKVVLKWPSGGPGAGLCPAPGPPEGHLSTILVPHELRNPILGTICCALIFAGLE